MIRTTVALVLLVWTATAVAETRRVAVVVGNNTGNAGQSALHFAEIDAGKVGRVLTELGGVAPADLYLVQGKRLATLEDVLRRAAKSIAAYRRAGDRVLAIFYYSGHSDGLALELERDRFTFAALRTWLLDTGAEVRIALVDSCKSGALVAAKGGTLGPAFSIRLTDEVLATGEALLTSSASDENALESTEIGGSFFTHHLVSGLRGAADSSGDGRVTLGEAYQYAYKHTIATSGATLAGPQHPTYDYRLTGQGELVLTELARPTAALSLPAGTERGLVIEAAREQVIAELGRGENVRIALVPGRYGVRIWSGGKAYEATVTIAKGEHRTVRWDELRVAALSKSYAKGRTREQRDLSIAIAGGGRAGIAASLDALGGMRAGLRFARGFSISVDVSTRSMASLRETSAFVSGGYRVGVGERLRASIALEIGGGAIVQTLGDTHASAAATIGPTGELAFDVNHRLAIALELQAPATLLDKDGGPSVTLLPALWLGVIVRP